MAFVDIDDAFDCNCDGGNDGTLGNLTCLNDEVTNSSCHEVKITQGLKIHTNHVPEAMSALTYRLINESIMNQGTLRLSPYDTNTEILDTNGVTTSEILGAETNDIICGASFIDDMEAGVNPARIRIWENASGAKIKMAEVEIEVTVATIDLIAESRDDDDNLVVSCPVVLFTETGASSPHTYVQIDSATTDGTTGLHTFSYEDDDEFKRIFYQKDLTPDQWDMSDAVKGT